jgi:hypothetical protein
VDTTWKLVAPPDPIPPLKAVTFFPGLRTYFFEWTILFWGGLQPGEWLMPLKESGEIDEGKRAKG